MSKKSCRLEKTNSLGICKRDCQVCSWWQTQEEIQKALDYKADLKEALMKPMRRSRW